MKDVGIDPVENHLEALAGGRTNCTNDVAANVIAEIGHAWATSASTPASARARIAFDTTFIAIPKFNLGIGVKGVQFLEENGARRFILALRPALRNAQVVVELVEVTDGGSIAQLLAKLLFEPAVNFYSRPVFLRCLGGVFEHRH